MNIKRWTLIVLGIVFSLTVQAQPLRSIAFYYGEEIPVDELKAFDAVVLHPTSSFNPARWNNPQSELFGYLSVGEVEKNDPEFPAIKKNWILGKNTTWNSVVVDWRNNEWRQFFLDKQFEVLWKKGYHNFFLDTLDSYQTVVKTDAERNEQQRALVTLVNEMKARHAEAKLIFNRGFEVAAELQGQIYAVAAESLFSGWDEARKRYYPIAESDRQWLMTELDKIKALQLPVIVIDYVDPAQKTLTRSVAKKISALDMIPYVTNGTLTTIGVSTVEVVPRKILVLYMPTREGAESENLSFTGVATPLEYFGYVPLLQSVKSLPKEDLSGRCAGIIVNLTSEQVAATPNVKSWILQQVDKKIPIVFLENLPFSFTDPIAKSLGLTGIDQPKMPRSVNVLKKNSSLEFETKLQPSSLDFTNVRAQNSDVYLQLRGNDGQISDAIAITPWGGYVLSPYFILNLSKEHNRWIIDPFEFLQKSLRLATLPVPETTTENGVRLMMVHVDGDGFANRGEWADAPAAGKVLLDSILQQYPIPTTVSVIEGEVGPTGLYPKFSPQFEAIAKKIFQLPWVEVASHTYSHPFNWRGYNESSFKEFEHLPIKGYDKFDLHREINGSVNYINQRLSGNNKPVRLIFWSGLANPQASTLQLVDDMNLLNLNGGTTWMSKDEPSLTSVSPLGIILDGQYQVFAAITNENNYTNLWTGPFWGFRRVIETFQMTETPRRLRPIDIYYHFYSASKLASLKALKEVYDWSLSQDILSIYASDYASKVMDFYKAVIFKRDDQFVIRSGQQMKEIRVPESLGVPDVQLSSNVIGYNPYQKANYVHLAGGTETSLALSTTVKNLPRLYSATGAIQNWHVLNKKIEFDIQSLRSMTVKIANADHCRVSDGKKSLTTKKIQPGLTEFHLTKDSHHVTLQCG